MSNKKGKITEDLTREYVSLNQNIIINTKERNEGLWDRFSKLKRRRYWWIYKINKVSGI